MRPIGEASVLAGYVSETIGRGDREAPVCSDRKDGGAGLGGAGAPHTRRPRLRVGSQGGMPTRSPPEAGLAGDEFRNLPYPWVLSHFDVSGAGKSTVTPENPATCPDPPTSGVLKPYRRSRSTRCNIPPFA